MIFDLNITTENAVAMALAVLELYNDKQMDKKKTFGELR